MTRSPKVSAASWLGRAIPALVALALTIGPASAQSWPEVVDAAKKEGKVTFYNNLQPNGIEPLLQKFREAYPGIQTEHVRLGSNPLIERFQIGVPPDEDQGRPAS